MCEQACTGVYKPMCVVCVFLFGSVPVCLHECCACFICDTMANKVKKWNKTDDTK